MGDYSALEIPEQSRERFYLLELTYGDTFYTFFSLYFFWDALRAPITLESNSSLLGRTYVKGTGDLYRREIEPTGWTGLFLCLCIIYYLKII